MTDTHTHATNETNAPSKKNGWFKRLFSNSNDNDLRETIEELIEDDNNGTQEDTPEQHERNLLANIFKLRDLTASDVMVPRVDIIAVDTNTTKEKLMSIYAETPRSRVAVYKDTLDNIVGTVHIKDFLGQTANKERYNLLKITRSVPIISPSMPVMDLLIQMRETRNHMALVIDEYGGIDGLVTLGDVIELITGEIDDIYDEDESPQIRDAGRNTYIADARLPLEDFEEKFKIQLLDEDEREEVDTLAGFVFSHAGRVPTTGEIIEHPSGFSFEIVEGDARRINLIKVHQKAKKSPI